MFKLFRRFFWLVLGFALGCGSSWALTRRVRRVTRRFVPSGVRERVRENVRTAVSEGRDAMRAREAELRGNVTAAPGK